MFNFVESGPSQTLKVQNKTKTSIASCEHCVGKNNFGKCLLNDIITVDDFQWQSIENSLEKHRKWIIMAICCFLGCYCTNAIKFGCSKNSTLSCNCISIHIKYRQKYFLNMSLNNDWLGKNENSIHIISFYVSQYMTVVTLPYIC